MKKKTAKRWMVKNSWKMARRKALGRKGISKLSNRWKDCTQVLVASN